MTASKRFLLKPLAASLLVLSASSALAFTDADVDGMDDQWELWWGFNPTDPADALLDDDSDNLTNLQEFTLGLIPLSGNTDGDAEPDDVDTYPADQRHAADTDGDTLPNGWEQAHGLDPFSNTDATSDMDGDTLTAVQEFALGTHPFSLDTDRDGRHDNLDPWPLDDRYNLDTDTDGMPDAWEKAHVAVLDFNNAADATDDPDADTLNNLQEFTQGTNPNNPDTDDDTHLDSADNWPTNASYNVDSDNDGLPDSWEDDIGFCSSCPEDANDPMAGDTDLLTPLQEFTLGTNPSSTDSDSDGTNDRADIAPTVAHIGMQDIDQDFDGIPNWWEMTFGLINTNANDANSNTDNDDRTALQEYQLGSWPDIANDWDDDFDGLPDAWEETNGLNPWNNADRNTDSDSDGLDNISEWRAGTSPQRADSDRDLLADAVDPWPTNPDYGQDSDNDGLPDSWETAQLPPLDPFNQADASMDDDGDTLSTRDEFLLGTDIYNYDTDGDFFSDNMDPWPLQADYNMDSDNDGLPDSWENDNGFCSSCPEDANDLMAGDTDRLSPLEEFLHGSNPMENDSDFDGLDDRRDLDPTVNHGYEGDLDADFDSMPRWWEQLHGFNDTFRNDAGADMDGDGRNNLEEYRLGSWPDIADDSDNDSDGLPDGWELAHNLDPLNAIDRNSDNDQPFADGLTAWQEYRHGSDPRYADGDRDGANDPDDRWPADPRYGLDQDMDGMPDSWEQAQEPALNPYVDDSGMDDDGDTLSNLQEFQAGSNPYLYDTDSDGFADFFDRWPADSRYTFDNDQDNLPDEWENDYGLCNSCPEDAADPMYGDNDRLSPLQEFLLGSDPWNEDSDFDGLDDRHDLDPVTAHINDGDTDNDFDGLPAWWEMLHLYSDFNAADAGMDQDNDGRDNQLEFLLQSWPDIADDVDTDHDGMPDGWELAHNLNPNNPFDEHHDFDMGGGDGLTNLQEYLRGTEPNDRDSDDDGVADGSDRWPTQVEYSLDTDNDGMPDDWEIRYGLCPMCTTDASDDQDADGVTNLQEFTLGTHPALSDTDGDGWQDDMDPWPADARYAEDYDNDGLPHEWEIQNGLNDFEPTDADDAMTNDSDRLTPRQEFALGTHPLYDDSDVDGMNDRRDADPHVAHFVDEDLDFDGLPRWWEQAFNMSDFDASDAGMDYDGDQRSNLQEFQLRSLPSVTDDNDSDHDGMPDGFERAHALNAATPDSDMDQDADGLDNGHEFRAGTDPQLADSDRDGVNDGTDKWPTVAGYSLDSDNDGMADEWEDANTLNKNSAADAAMDLDGDTRSNRQEFEGRNGQRSNPALANTDGDIHTDQYDFWPTDPDAYDNDINGLPDQWETSHFGYNISASDANSLAFSDDDWLSPVQELALGTNPLLPDSDSDGLEDAFDRWPTAAGYQNDEDFDGMPSEWEITYSLNRFIADDGAQDLDTDGLTNLQEFRFGSAPDNTDSDADTIPDYTEVFTTHTHPGLSDTDSDTVADNIDIFPNNGAEWVDTDNDGTGNNADTDDDNDGYYDYQDDYPLDPAQHDANAVYPLNGLYKGSVINDSAAPL